MLNNQVIAFLFSFFYSFFQKKVSTCTVGICMVIPLKGLHKIHTLTGFTLMRDITSTEIIDKIQE